MGSSIMAPSISINLIFMFFPRTAFYWDTV